MTTVVQGQRSIKLRKQALSQKSQTAAKGWHLFRSLGEDFLVRFPSKPQFELGDTVKGEVPVRGRYSYYGEAIWLSVTFQDLGFPLDSRHANDLGASIEKMLAAYTIERSGKTIRVQRLAKNILEEERVVRSRWSNNNRHVITRFIQRNSRLYTLGCVTLVDGQEIDKKLCRRFLNSFRIIGVPR